MLSYTTHRFSVESNDSLFNLEWKSSIFWLSLLVIFAANNYLFKVNIKDTKRNCLVLNKKEKIIKEWLVPR